MFTKAKFIYSMTVILNQLGIWGHLANGKIAVISAINLGISRRNLGKEEKIMRKSTYITVRIRKKENLNFLRTEHFRYKRFITNNKALS